MAQQVEKPICNEETDGLIQEPTQFPLRRSGCSKRHRDQQIVCLSAVGLVSVLLNVGLTILLLRVEFGLRERQKSPYVGLEFDTINTMNHNDPYGSSNRNETERAIFWESLDGSSGQVAVDKSWAVQKGLPPTQEFSWDEGKAVYSLRGFHAQHCLRKLHRWVAISHHDGAQLDQYEHVVHCLSSLLDDIRCYADDTPMVSPPKASTSTTWGQGQQRQCRDWNKLEKWAEGQNACFSYINETQGVRSMFDRYKWCPQDSPYGAKMRSTLSLPGDWNPEVPKDIDSLPAYWKDF